MATEIAPAELEDRIDDRLEEQDEGATELEGQTDGVDMPDGPLPEQPVEQSPEAPRGETPEERHERELHEAETECSEAYLELIRLKDAVKAQNDYLKSCGERLSRLKLRGPEELPLFDRPAAEGQKLPTEDAADELPAWWNHDTSHLFDEPLPGFGKKLQAAIVEKCPTIGELEELRGGEGLTAIKGVSAAKADELTDRILSYCARHQSVGPQGVVSGDEDQREEWEKARDECEALCKVLESLPDEADFADGAWRTIDDIRDWIVEHEHVTEDQLTAIANTREAAEKWQR